MAQYQFNALQYEPMGPAVENWPDGWVLVVAKTTEMKPNQGGNTGRLSIQVEALEGPMKGKQHYIGLNLFHDNPQTVEIANRQLTSIVHVTLGANKNQFNFNDTNEICGYPFYALVANKTDDKNVTRTNFVGFRDQRGNEPKGNAGGGGGPSPGPGPGAGWQSGPAQQPQTQPPADNWQQQPQQQPPNNGGGQPWQNGPGGGAPAQQPPPQQQQPWQQPQTQQPPQQPQQQPWNPAGGGQPQQQQDAAPWRR